MININFIGRVGAKGAQVIDSKNGQFVTMDVATSQFANGQDTTVWVRVRSNKPNHINLAQWLTKGRLIFIKGTLGTPKVWQDADGNNHVQIIANAENIDFIKVGKPKGNDEVAVVEKNPEDVPAETPTDKEDDVPF